MSDDELRRLALAIAEHMPTRETSCLHGITDKQAKSLMNFADFWSNATGKAVSTAVGFVVIAMMLAAIAGASAAAKSLLGK